MNVLEVKTKNEEDIKRADEIFDIVVMNGVETRYGEEVFSFYVFDTMNKEELIEEVKKVCSVATN